MDSLPRSAVRKDGSFCANSSTPSVQAFESLFRISNWGPPRLPPCNPGSICSPFASLQPPGAAKEKSTACKGVVVASA
eukprot:4723098-Amphidinium_carterae.1